jgi:HK97 family phage major capsid protein
MEIRDMSLSEIETRFAEIRTLVESETDMNVEALELLTKETDELEERKTQLNKIAEERAALIEQAKSATVIVEQQEERKVNQHMEIREIAALPEYRTGWLKSQMGMALNEEEKRSVALAGAAVVPTVTVDKIMALLLKKAPLLNEITLFRANGPVNVPVQGTNTAAALHTENAGMDAAPDTWTNIALASYEIVKFVRVSKSLMNQAIDSFEGYLVEQIAELNWQKKSNRYILYGTGDAQPKGINAAQVWTDGSNGVDWGAAAPTAAEMMELFPTSRADTSPKQNGS